MVDETGAVVGGSTYDAFGNTLTDTIASGNRFGFTGQWADVDGLMFLRARFYDSVVGRFLSVDPAPGSGNPSQVANPYVYCGNNPLLITDPSGEFWWGVAIGAVAGGVGSIASDVAAGHKINWGHAGTAAVGGAVGGAVATVCPWLGGYALSAVSMGLNQLIWGEDPSGVDWAFAALPGASRWSKSWSTPPRRLRGHSQMGERASSSRASRDSGCVGLTWAAARAGAPPPEAPYIERLAVDMRKG